MSSDDFYYSEVDGGYRIGTIGPSTTNSCAGGPKGLKNAANLTPVTPSKYSEKDIIEIGRCAFYYSNIEKITVSSPVKTIENCAFYGCSSLKEAVLPSTISTINWFGFYGCPKLSLITFCRKEAITVGSDAFSLSNSSVIINVPTNSLITTIGSISTKKVLNPSCLFSLNNVKTRKRRSRLLSTFIPIVYLLVVWK